MGDPNEVLQWCVRPLFWVQDLSYVIEIYP